MILEGGVIPNLRKLDGEVRNQDEFGALPLLCCCGDFLLRVTSQQGDCNDKGSRMVNSRLESCTC